MDEATTTVLVRSQHRIWIPKVVFESLGIEEGDYIEVTLRKK